VHLSCNFEEIQVERYFDLESRETQNLVLAVKMQTISSTVIFKNCHTTIAGHHVYRLLTQTTKGVFGFLSF
jgi:hypothetical protein